jgi:hypothetical protein
MRLFLVPFLFFVLALLAVPVSAQIEIINPIGASDIPTLIDTIATWLLGIGSVIAVIIVLWAALLFMTSGGSQTKVTQAKQTLLYAVIGLTVLLLAKGVTLVIQNFLAGNF